jgi:hypothetical protein
MMAGVSPAATVTFNIVPEGGSAGDTVTVAPGASVDYRIEAIVTSDDPVTTDNNGLAFFSVDVLTDLGVTQSAADAFDPAIGSAFPLVQSLGQPSDDDILEIGGGQNIFSSGTAVTGIGVGATQTLATGSLTTPSTEGTFTITLDASANVLDTGTDTSASTANVVTGSGFTISTMQDTGNGDGDGGGNGDTTPPPTGGCGSGAPLFAAATFLMLGCLRLGGTGRWRR